MARTEFRIPAGDIIRMNSLMLRDAYLADPRFAEMPEVEIKYKTKPLSDDTLPDAQQYLVAFATITPSQADVKEIIENIVIPEGLSDLEIGQRKPEDKEVFVDGLEARIIALEQKVADLEIRVANLEGL